jgi:hypothetical protein
MHIANEAVKFLALENCVPYNFLKLDFKAI